MSEQYISAQEAADILDVSVSTIYSYVSRDLIHSEPDDATRRIHRYRLADVKRLKARQKARQQPERRAEGALHWGVPVIESAVTFIEKGRIYYRGWDALILAQESAVFEEVTSILWEANIDDLRAIHLAAEIPKENSLPPLERMQNALIHAQQADPAAFNLKPQAVHITGWRILHILAQTVGQREHCDNHLAKCLAIAWGYRDEHMVFDLLDDALILCADHELNVSAFAARAVASAQVSPYQVVVAGLAALSGTKHGGFTHRVAALFDEVGTPERAAEVIRARLRRGDPVPGFGHQLYPHGDPRARHIFDQTVKTFPQHPEVNLARAIEVAARDAIDEQMTVDFALTTLARALGEPSAAITLFALGRTAGWIAHALEGYAGPMIRPRARYVGPPPKE